MYYLGGSGAATRLDIADETIDALKTLIESPAPPVIPISAVEFNAVAVRPRYSALSNDRASRRFGVRLDPWRIELCRMLHAGLE